jgi:four helix bundle protein
MQIKSYKDLSVWQKSMELVVHIYNLVKDFPKEEVYGISSQLKRAAVSIPSNIAEGSRRSSRKDFCNFIYNSFGSGAELETQLEIAKRLSFGNSDKYQAADSLLDEVMRMLNKLIIELESKN